MKIAVICVGLPHKNHKKQKPVLDTLNEIFKDDDIYYHTWERAEKHVMPDYKDKLMTCPEPEITYHPFIDTPREPNINPRYIVDRDAALREYKRKPQTAAAKKKHGHLQILGYADAFSRIPKKYDLYIKTRWDLMIHKDANFKPFYQKALEVGPVGFGPTDKTPNPKLPLVEQPRELGIRLADRWQCYIADQMIFHSPKHFDPELVWKLHKEQTLHPIEWGWWQVLSHPYGGDIHTCVWNGVKIRR